MIKLIHEREKDEEETLKEIWTVLEGKEDYVPIYLLKFNAVFSSPK